MDKEDLSKNVRKTQDRTSLNYVKQILAAAVAQCVRAFASQAEGSVFES